MYQNQYEGLAYLPGFLFRASSLEDGSHRRLLALRRKSRPLKSQHCCDFLTRLRSPPDQLHFANTPVKGYLQNGAGNGARTRHLRLGKAALYQMSYSRIFSLSSFRVVRAKRFELIRPGAPEPKSGASANSATPAFAQKRAGDPSEIRTPDTLIKSQVLYRLS